jgi:hypothetical protein
MACVGTFLLLSSDLIKVEELQLLKKQMALTKNKVVSGTIV